MRNAIMAIYPYRHQGLWVFDDESTGLVQEPFIAGADLLIDRAIQYKGIENAENGFRIIFSSGEFPGYDFKLSWLREGDGGNWYYSEDFEMEGWLCPALLEYFPEPPPEIYAKFEGRS